MKTNIGDKNGRKDRGKEKKMKYKGNQGREYNERRQEKGKERNAW